ncbi:hypothetical protein CMV_028691 [Castanea mollissima]|uniref:Uncharacterized protein n=1 Tax=Castanea mollissima TaxID=60419 RepID=A0A8J4Q6Z8_9ROSI|nr:hypothetical protein CMV_028691 [Castanea mollissima]
MGVIQICAPQNGNPCCRRRISKPAPNPGTKKRIRIFSFSVYFLRRRFGDPASSSKLNEAFSGDFWRRKLRH